MGFPIPDTGAVSEDTGVVGGFLVASGDIDYLVGDDAGEWTAETLVGAYGSQLVIDVDGNWTYQADNSDAAIQALDSGSTLTEVFTVTSAGGTSTITITINGLDEPPCFVAGTKIDTPSGPRRVEDLVVGDLVLTRDSGAQQILWTGSRTLSAAELDVAEHLRPIHISANAIAPGIPSEDLYVSAQHHMLLQGSQYAMLFGQAEVLCPAKHLINGVSITRQETGSVQYHHLLLADHQILISSNCPSESFYPGQVGLAGFEGEARQEVLELFPELRVAPAGYGKAARLILRQFEASVLNPQDESSLPDRDSINVSA